MQRFYKEIWCILSSSLLFGSTISWCSPLSRHTLPATPQLIAQAAPLDAASILGPGKPPVLNSTDLHNEAALAAKVSFEVKGQILSDLLADLQKQTGVVLALDPASPLGEVRVTARVKAMTLADVMGALGHLYGAVWKRSAPDHFTISKSDRGEVEIKLPQLSGAAQNLWEAEQTQGINWADELLPLVDEHKLRSAEGIPLNDLPEEIKQKIRTKWLQSTVLDLAGVYSKATIEAIEAGTLHIEAYKISVPNPRGKGWVTQTLPAYAKMIIRAPDGTPITDALASFPPIQRAQPDAQR